MTPEEHDSIRKTLDDFKAELVAEKEAAHEDTKPVELDQTRVGRLSRMDSMQQQAMAQEQERRRDIQLKRIEGAYQRLEKGSYGQCATCTKPIEDARLEFDPTIFFCQDCASKVERQ